MRDYKIQASQTVLLAYMEKSNDSLERSNAIHNALRDFLDWFTLPIFFYNISG